MNSKQLNRLEEKDSPPVPELGGSFVAVLGLVDDLAALEVAQQREGEGVPVDEHVLCTLRLVQHPVPVQSGIEPAA